MKKNFIKIAIFFFVILTIYSCTREDLYPDPNAAGEHSYMAPSLQLNTITSQLIRSEEMPFELAHRLNQYYVANDNYYWGGNSYNWDYSGELYTNVYTEARRMEENNKQLGNVYVALAKFARAYSVIWLSQRVGDVPMSEAGDAKKYETPKFDTQKEVYKNSLLLLEEANNMIADLIQKAPAIRTQPVSGDIFGLTHEQWQKFINSFALRVLISMSKRTEDTPDLNIKGKFAEIVNNPAKYPVLSGTENVSYKFNGVNLSPIGTRSAYTYGANISKTLLDITTRSQDPRTYVFATPAPAKYNTQKVPVSDFSAYVGSSTNTGQGTLNLETDAGDSTGDKGPYSYINYLRYMNNNRDGSKSEPYILIGAAETYFNIAEGINRGWAAGNATESYNKGIEASLTLYGLTDGQKYAVGDRTGKPLGIVTINISKFLTNENVAYKGGLNGLEQILTQKYVALFCNSGYEGYYNWRRTGYPEFQEGGTGIGTANNRIPKRWKYPSKEYQKNPNCKLALQSQYGSTDDDVTKLMWLIK